MLPDLQVNQVLILGDFNSCELSEYLPALQRYLDCPTRLNQTIDRCNGKPPMLIKRIADLPSGNLATM